MIDDIIRPTAFQTGEIICESLFNFPFTSFIRASEELYLKANVTRINYLNELFLLTAVALIYAVRSAKVSNEIIDEVIKGFLSKLTFSKTEMAAFAIRNIDEVCPYYAEANQDDLDKPKNSGDLSDIYMAFGDRILLLYGEETEERGNACALLTMMLPKALWVANFNAAKETLEWSGLLSASQSS